MLLDKLRGLLSYEDIARLKPNELSEITAEPPGAQNRRDQLENQVKVLVEVIGICRKFKQQDVGQYVASLGATVFDGRDGNNSSATPASTPLRTSLGNMFRKSSRAATRSKQKPVSSKGAPPKPASSSSLAQESSSATADAKQAVSSMLGGGISDNTAPEPSSSRIFFGRDSLASIAPKQTPSGGVFGALASPSHVSQQNPPKGSFGGFPSPSSTAKQLPTSSPFDSFARDNAAKQDNTFESFAIMPVNNVPSELFYMPPPKPFDSSYGARKTQPGEWPAKFVPFVVTGNKPDRSRWEFLQSITAPPQFRDRSFEARQGLRP